MKNFLTSSTTHFSKRIGVAFLTGALTVTGLSACSLLGGEVAQKEVEKSISDILEEKIGRKPERIECPGGLKAEEGATMECKLHDSGEIYGVNVTADTVDGDNVHYSIEVADQPE
ncbi:DUF4333 domain-containing protein [Corynebacterium macclintockiae]|uniref:DUF4333 domain-containing protein n=1 Tax=Corynebacterium macclintockiae TaxID=2913501 RepID=UPI003EC09045